MLPSFGQVQQSWMILIKCSGTRPSERRTRAGDQRQLLAWPFASEGRRRTGGEFRYSASTPTLLVRSGLSLDWGSRNSGRRYRTTSFYRLGESVVCWLFLGHFFLKIFVVLQPCHDLLVIIVRDRLIFLFDQDFFFLSNPLQQFLHHALLLCQLRLFFLQASQSLNWPFANLEKSQPTVCYSSSCSQITPASFPLQMLILWTKFLLAVKVNQNVTRFSLSSHLVEKFFWCWWLYLITTFVKEIVKYFRKILLHSNSLSLYMENTFLTKVMDGEARGFLLEENKCLHAQLHRKLLKCDVQNRNRSIAE